MYCEYVYILLLCLVKRVELFMELGKSAEVVHYYPSNYHSHEDRKNCTPDTAIIDKLLNGTGYNKYRIPRKAFGIFFQIFFLLFC